VKVFSVRDQRRLRALPFGPILHDVRKQALRMGVDARGELDGLQPSLADVTAPAMLVWSIGRRLNELPEVSVREPTP
jgi:hypothetical protein